MYRAIGLYAKRAGADTKNAAAVAALLPQVRVELKYVDGTQRVLLCGEDVSEAIRAEAIGMAASDVSAHPAVRSFLLDTQRNMALTHGRDIGTVILPDATVKIFLTASPEARAKRRMLELQQKGQPADYETVLEDIRQRDWQDTHRATAPLKQAEDAVLVDTSELDFEESFQTLKNLILDRVGH